MVINFSVHVYAKERLCDNVLIPHSKNYGILGKNIIAPLRQINNKSVERDINEGLIVAEFYQWIKETIYSGRRNMKDPYVPGKTTLDFVKEYDVLKIYILKKGIRYSIQDKNKPLRFYLQKLGVLKSNVIDIQILVSANAGTVLTNHGIRFYMNCREGKRHNEPHVHVDIRHGESGGSFSLKTGKKLSGGKISNKDQRIIREIIIDNQEKFLIYWNEHTDGLNVDLNQVLGLIGY